jgi:hypothetical protein
MRIRAGILIEHFLACVRECRDIISHLDQAEFDQFAQMIWVGRQQSPLRLDVSKRPNKVYRSKGIDPRYAPNRVFIHSLKFLLKNDPSTAGAGAVTWSCPTGRPGNEVRRAKNPTPRHPKGSYSSRIATRHEQPAGSRRRVFHAKVSLIGVASHRLHPAGFSFDTAEPSHHSTVMMAAAAELGNRQSRKEPHGVKPGRLFMF